MEQKGDSQSSCRYANPLAEPRAIFILFGQLRVGALSPAMSFFFNKTLYGNLENKVTRPKSN